MIVHFGVGENILFVCRTCSQLGTQGSYEMGVACIATQCHLFKVLA